MAIVLFYHNLYVFNIYNWRKQKTAALLPKFLKVVLKPQFLGNNSLTQMKTCLYLLSVPQNFSEVKVSWIHQLLNGDLLYEQNLAFGPSLNWTD